MEGSNGDIQVFALNYHHWFVVMDGYGGFLFLNVTALFLRDQWMKDDRFKLTRISPGKT